MWIIKYEENQRKSQNNVISDKHADGILAPAHLK